MARCFGPQDCHIFYGVVGLIVFGIILFIGILVGLKKNRMPDFRRNEKNRDQLSSEKIFAGILFVTLLTIRIYGAYCRNFTAVGYLIEIIICTALAMLTIAVIDGLFPDKNK